MVYRWFHSEDITDYGWQSDKTEEKNYQMERLEIPRISHPGLWHLIIAFYVMLKFCYLMITRCNCYEVALVIFNLSILEI